MSAMMANERLRYLLHVHLLLGTIFSLSYALQGHEYPNYTEVTIPQGHLQGTIWSTYGGRNISAFLGIPYAQPPIGHLRFANPVPASGWNGTWYAAEEGNQCPQPTAALAPDQDYENVIGDEDCLYLNVYTPKTPEFSLTSPNLLPVMVFIHGGGFYGWSSSSNETGPGFLLDKDVVLVTLNYRLGLLGFLSTGDEAASGNWGLKDQVMALRWVQENIEHFGGDPNQVTLFGESAGAASVHLLTMSDLATGLFHRYITQSGSALSKWAYRPRATYKEQSFRVGEVFNCSIKSSKSMIACLRKVNFKDITSANLGYSIWRIAAWGPTDEPESKGAFLIDSPANLIANENIRDLPWLVGVCRDEGLLSVARFYENPELLQLFAVDLDEILAEGLSLVYQADSGVAWLKAIKSHYFDDVLVENVTEILPMMTDVFGDLMFKQPTYTAIQRQFPVVKSPQYLYSFEHRGVLSYSYVFSGSLMDFGVSHSDDLLYLFPNTARFSKLNKTLSENDYEMMKTMVELWTSFANNGTPTASALNGQEWPPYSLEESYLQIGDNADISLKVQHSLFQDSDIFLDWS